MRPLDRSQQDGVPGVLDLRSSSARQATARGRPESTSHAAAALEALQAIDEAMSSADVEESIPQVLRIFASAFGATATHFFERDDEGPVRLRWWYDDAGAVAAGQLRASADPRFALGRRLATHVVVPGDDVTSSASGPARPPGLSGSRVATVFQLDVSGAGIERLHGIVVPLRACGRYLGSIGVCRGSDAGPYADADVALIECLAPPLSMAFLARRLAAESKVREAALVRATERRGAAEDRVIELAKANTSLRATLAAELVRLGEHERDGAIAREQRTAARQRADELERANEALRRRDGLTTALAEGTKLLLSAHDFDAAIPEALGRIGTAAGLHRVKVLLARRHGSAVGTHDLTYEWCAPGLVRQAQLGLTEFAAEDIAPYIERSRLDQFSWETIDEVPAHLQASFRRVGMKSMGVVPVFVGDEYAGVVAFDDCERTREASMPEIEALAVAARTIGAAIHRQRLERARAEALAKANRVLRNVNERLAEEREPIAALRFMLREISALIGNEGAALYRYVPAERALRFVCGVEAGRIVDVLTGHPYGRSDRPVAVEDFPAWPALCAARAPVFVAHRPTLTAPPSIDYHEERGHRLLVQSALMVGDEPFGLLGLGFTDEQRPSETRLEMLNALAQQAALALQLQRLADEARASAVAREQAAAACRRAAELERSGLALQKTIDAVAKLETLAAFIPLALRIVAEAFEVDAAGFFEHPGETIHLRFWLDRGVVLGPDALPNLTDDTMTVVRDMARGFTVPTEHLGVDFRKRSAPSILHHRTATASPHLHAFAVARGWDWELNVPLMVDGVANGAITLFRPEGRRFTEADVSLASALGKQIALAMQTSRIAEREREALVSRERATELARANDALARSTAQLVSYDGLPTFLEAVVAEAIAAAGAVSGAVFLLDAEGAALHLHAMNVRGATLDIAEDPLCDAYRDPIPTEGNRAWAEISTRRVFWMDYATRDPNDWPQSYEWHNALGHRFGVCVPMVYDDAAVGFLGLVYDRSVDVQPTDTRLEVARVLAQQATLALRLTQLAEEARLAAIARERVEAAEQRATQLVRANDLLRGSVLDVGSDESIDRFVERMLRQAMALAGAPYGAVLRVDPATDLTRMAVLCIDGEVVAHDDPRSAIRREPSAWSTPLVERPHDADGISVEPLAVVARHFRASSLRWHEARGNHFMVVKALRHGSRVSGFLELGFRAERVLDGEQKELVRALANQIGLVISLDDAAQAVREAEVLREREAAERERAGELMVMNAALRGSLERLTTFGALDDFLESLVREAVDAVGAASGAIYSHDEATDLLSLRAFLLHGERYRPSVATDSPYARPVPASTVYVWSHAVARRGAVWIDVDDPTLALHEGSREFHRRYGHRHSVALPIFHGDHCLGLFALSFDRTVSVRPRESRLEICRVLAQQAALAMRLSDLGAHALDAGKREAIVAERNRIAGEIHDSLAQSFTSIAMQSEALTANLGQPANWSEGGDRRHDAAQRRVLHTMRLIERTARLGLAEARSSVLALRPSEGDGSLVDALRSLAERSDVVGTIDCASIVSGVPRPLPPVSETALLRIAQEALGNAMRHAHPTRVALCLDYTATTVKLSVEDDGCGLPKRRETLGRGFGISGMAARAESIGGEFSLRGREPSGTVVSVVLSDPVDHAGEPSS